jgi:cell division protein FtsW
MGIGTYVKESVHSTTQASRRAKPVLGDMVLVTALVALSIFGLLMLYSASTDFSFRIYEGNANYLFNKQLLWIALGTIAAFVLARLDYHLWRRLAIPAMVVTIALLIAVLISNQPRYGSVRALFGGSVQPSELAKLVTVIYLSIWLYSKREHLHDVQLGLVPLAVILGVIGGLIYIQPDLSATVTIFILGGLLFFLAGGDLRQIILFLLVALVAGWIVVQISNTGRARLASYLAGLKDPLQSGYHVKRSFEAIIKGGIFGVGIGKGTGKLTGLPFPSTDSIFAVVMEELGLVGALVLISFYGILLWRGIKIARHAPDSLGMMMAAGLTFWIVIEASINLGVMVGLFPFAGNALPFVSAGGSNLISSLAAIGILINISRQAGQPAAETEIEERRLYGASIDLRRRDRRRRLTRTRRP